MARVIVEDIESESDLLDLATHLLDALRHGDTEPFTAPGTLTLTRRAPGLPSADDLAAMVDLDGGYDCHDTDHRPACTCRQDACATDPRQGRLLDPARHAGPVPYTACPRAGSHDRLTDCWMCWSDVQRGAIPVQRALRPR